jgi:hypothetical protein
MDEPKLKVPEYRVVVDSDGYYMLQYRLFGGWIYVDDAWTRDITSASSLWRDYIELNLKPPVPLDKKGNVINNETTN